MREKSVGIAVIQKDSKILMRKKPEGSLPYSETWYLFGSEVTNNEPEKQVTNYLKEHLGIEVNFLERLGMDEEVKEDHDGKKTHFAYQDMLFEYVSGKPIVPAGSEKIEWVDIEKLEKYDLVPPSRKLFKKLGWL